MHHNDGQMKYVALVGTMMRNGMEKATTTATTMNTDERKIKLPTNDDDDDYIIVLNFESYWLKCDAILFIIIGI